MKRIYVRPLSQEMQQQLAQAQAATALQRRRTIKCPYCQHNAIVIFEDARGHVQTKCKRCGEETIFDISEVMHTML